MRRLAVLCALAPLLALCSAAPASDEAVVVTSPPSATETAQNSLVDKPTTEGPVAPIEIYSMHVYSEISSRYAHTVISSRVANPGHKAQETTFTVLLPETTFVSGFLMQIDGKVYKAYVKEKEEAKKIYNDAKESGQTAAHITTKARDSNHFTVSVNLEPNSKATFNLTCEELLSRRLGVYNNIINLNPGKIIDDLKVVVHIKERSNITVLRVPELRTGNEIDADEEDKANEMATITLSDDKKEATVIFTPSAEQQKILRDVFRAKLKAEKEKNRPKQDTYGYYGPITNLEDDKPKDSDGLIGQFVVQYDVDRDPQNGEVLVYDGYFVHFFAPSDLKPLNKHVVFVLDISGSMIGRKIIQLKEAMLSILDNLNPGDYFNIIEFSYNSRVYDLDNVTNSPVYGSSNSYYYGYEEKPPGPSNAPPPPPFPVTPDYIEKAKNIIKNLDANGGTNIIDALTIALRVANSGIHPKKEELPKPIANQQKPDSSDGKSSDGGKAEAPAKDKLTDEIKKSDDKELSTDKPAQPEPIIIFLTDGDPTVGEQNPDKMLTTVLELNSGKRQSAIFSLAFGEDADRNFLKRLALRNWGFLRHIYEAADAAQQLNHFYQQVSSPILSGVKFVYPPDQVEEGGVTQSQFHALFRGGEIVVAGKLAKPEDTYVMPTIKATSIRGPIDFIPKVPKQEEQKTQFAPTERLWAYLTIKQLLDKKDAIIKEDKPLPLPDKESNDATTEKPVTEQKKLEDKALALALKYSFVTPLTSLVVVKPNASSAVDAESVDKISNPGYYPQANYASGGALALSGQQSWSASLLPAASRGSTMKFAMMGAPSAGVYSRGGSSNAVRFNSRPYVPSHSRIQAPSADTDFDSDALPESIVDPVPPASPALAEPIPAIDATHNSVPVVLATSAPPDHPLRPYHLEVFSWLVDYFFSGPDPRLELLIDGATVVLKLTADPSTLTAVDPPCSNTESGLAGVCKYITSCPGSELVLSNIHNYSQHYCSREGYAGLCCSLDP